MKLIRPFSIACLAALACVSTAWDALGHMVVADIAYRQLDQETKDKIHKILKKLPRARKSQANPTNARDLFLFAAIYPDVVRSASSPERKQHSRDSHFINFLFDADGVERGQAKRKETILKRLDAYTASLPDATGKDQARQLAWLEHLAGDIHQPFHCAARITPAHKGGDLGGNLFLLEPPDEDGKGDNLHSYWDKTLTRNFKRQRGEKEYAQAQRVAAALLAEGGPSDAEVVESSYEAWARDSYGFARQQGYVGLVEERAPDADYEALALRTTKKKVVLAGFRLAALIKRLVE